MPNIAVDCSGLDAARADRLAGAVRRSVVAALPETGPVCSCRVRLCAAAGPGDAGTAGTARPFAWIDVAMFPGRSLDWKRALYAALIAGCVEAGVEKEAVSITLREPGLENWGVRGGIPASDVFAPSPEKTGSP